MRQAAMALAALAIVTAMGPGSAMTAPKPSAIPLAWEVEFDSIEPRAIMVQPEGESKPRLFWYLKYTVTNHYHDKEGKTQDLLCTPSFTLYTDTGQVIKANMAVPDAVYQQIVKIENDPLMLSPNGMAGKESKLLYGADNAKTSVAILPDFDPAAGQFDIFVGGLSGESRTVTLQQPVTETAKDFITGQPVTTTVDKIVLVKTLQLTYSVPGEAAARKHTAPTLVEKKWVMR
ncbi:MAG: hypothetical protein NT031_15040 [Planctomycetota bacterium]|nr:hypothetical protein [Planctomycetota bacterium]